MSSAACASASARLSVERNTPHNYVAHVVDGGLYMGALALVNANTVLPAMAKDLGAPNWLVSFMPVILTVGLLLPPVFTAHWLDTLTRFKPLCMVTGVFQRLPFLVAGLVLVFASDTLAGLSVATVVVAQLVCGLVTGISLTGWQQLVARTLPAHRFSSVFALRYLIASAVGVAGGWVIASVLAQHPGARGYGILHLYAFGLVVLSYGAFSLIRERPEPRDADEPRLGMRQNLRAMPGMIRRNRTLGLLVLARLTMNGTLILIPFLAIHARSTLGKPEGFVGDLTMSHMIGALVGNAVSAWLGDRRGGKIVMILSRMGYLLVAAGAVVARSEFAFHAVFVVFGFSFYADQTGTQVLSLETVPRERRSTALAVLSFVNMPGMLLATGISAAVTELGGSIALLAALAGVCVAASLVALLPIPEPRGARTPA